MKVVKRFNTLFGILLLAIFGYSGIIAYFVPRSSQVTFAAAGVIPLAALVIVGLNWVSKGFEEKK